MSKDVGPQVDGPTTIFTAYVAELGVLASVNG